ncbi:EAL domain-containing protein [Pelagibacterium xiamenense]|uniref:EAL domain-containing protein n=1 Tax=Pelagibacterium xiamenense TaxID=2901140 RepID=UPI001E433133|nr:EAL domain-containing protein [Pelagibacterium xiamenense]
MTQSRHLLAIIAVCIFAVGGAALGTFQLIDEALRNLRFAAGSRPASGEIVLIDVDPADIMQLQSASAVRGMYASVVDIALGAGATDIVVETRLGGATGLSGDDLLADALARGAGKVRTVAYAMPVAGQSDESLSFQLPLNRFSAVAPPVTTSVYPEADGRVRHYRNGTIINGKFVPSLAAALNPGSLPDQERFAIDFSIDAATIPVIEVRDVLTGRADVGRLAGKQVLVGLSGATLQQSVLVPRFGVVSGSLVQILAAETLKQGRPLVELGIWAQIGLIVAVVLAFLFGCARIPLVPLVLGCVGCAVVLELLALALQIHSGIVLDTAAVHVALAGMLVIALVRELEARGLSTMSAAQERDSMRGILARVVADNFDGVVVVDHRHRIRAASRFACEMMESELIGKPIEATLPNAFVAALSDALNRSKTVEEAAEIRITPRAGDERIIEYVVTTSEAVSDEVNGAGSGRVACLTFRDVTERRHSEERLNYLARHDPQTGALSRIAFVETLTDMLSTPDYRKRGVTVFLIGIDRLKIVNDTLGYGYGNRLLQQVVARLQLAGAATVARLEGNNFAVLREGLLPEGAQDFAEEIIAQVSRPYAMAGHHAIVGASVGMTDSELSGFDPDTIIRHASMALSAAADRHGDAVVPFAREMTERIRHKQDMEVALRAALARGEFSVHYQTQVDLDTSAVVGVEALVRWTHPQLGNVSPGEFIPAAEETGLIIDLGRWVLKTACAEVAGWAHPVRLSVNVSPMQFEYGDIVADVRDALTSSGLAPERLDIEITEGLLVTETGHVIDKLNTLRGDGVKIALDDFGTGYSSLSYLGRLPVDTLKIDQSFVRGLPDDPEATAIVRAVLMLSDSLGKEVVAEGIESVDQAWLLRLAGCRTGQGYFFGRPAPAADTLAAIAEPVDDRLGTTTFG